MADETKNVYEENEELAEDNEAMAKEMDAFDFEPTFESYADLTFNTSCFCCSLSFFFGAEDLMACKGQNACLCTNGGGECQIFQCTDQAERACCLGTSKCSTLDATTDEFSCCYGGNRGVFLCCMSGGEYCKVCDPCGMESCTFVKTMCQCLCINQRCAIPCDDDQPMTCSCCGFFCMGDPAQEGAE